MQYSRQPLFYLVNSMETEYINTEAKDKDVCLIVRTVESSNCVVSAADHVSVRASSMVRDNNLFHLEFIVEFLDYPEKEGYWAGKEKGYEMKEKSDIQMDGKVVKRKRAVIMSTMLIHRDTAKALLKQLKYYGLDE